jgi:hypothetical protein
MPPAPMQEIREGGSLGLRVPPTGRTSAAARVRCWSTAWTRGGARHRTGASSPPRHRRRCDRAMALRARLDPHRGRLMSTPTCCGRAWRRFVRGDAIGCGRRRGIAAAGKRRGGESGEVEQVLDPHRPHRPLYIAADGGRMGAPATAMWTARPMREKRPSTRKPSRAARYGLIWGSARVALRASPAAEHIRTVAV